VVQKGTSIEKLVYNALGERIKTSGGAAGTILYAYDQAGHLLGEYCGTGALIEETVWLGDIPVATLRPGTPVAIYYVQTDQLNTPRQVTRPSDNAQMWRWFSDPFGTTAPNQNPQSAGTFVYNLRFPGQLYDPQIGISYNYMRDYDPQVGRYVESDPIGIYGGSWSTYSYTNDNPISRIDPLGEAGAIPLSGPAAPGLTLPDWLTIRWTCTWHRWVDFVDTWGYSAAAMLPAAVPTL
jgi:RHS repeat-associated protein